MKIDVEIVFLCFSLSENEVVPLRHHALPFADLISTTLNVHYFLLVGCFISLSGVIYVVFTACIMSSVCSTNLYMVHKVCCISHKP